MTGLCPHCRVPVTFPDSGQFTCNRCKHPFEVAVGFCRTRWAAPQSGLDADNPSLYAAAQPGADGLPTALNPCASHPTNEAAFSCERCGDFICGLCLTAVEGRNYCPQCFGLLYERGGLQFIQKRFSAPALSLCLGLGGLFTCFFGLPFAIAGLITGIRALGELERRPELRGRGMAIAGIALSSLALLVMVGGTAALVWRWAR